MAMTVIINALIFHEALAEAEFFISDPQSPPPSGDQPPSQRRLRHLRKLLPPGDFDIDALILEWRAVLEINYWPIFATASEIILKLSEETAAAVLTPLRRGAHRLVQRGVTKSHDLTGVIFQRLIADRKFLATFYTRPAAAALLAGLAIPADRAPGGAEWGDDSIHALQIGDFACGTGTLLSAAYQRISLLHELHGGDPKSLHQAMMKNGLVDLDVLNIAVHLTAAQLAGAHPDVPFDGECLLTMPYGGDSASIGSLELLAEHTSPDMIDQAAAVTAGGRSPEDVQDLVSRVGHNQFDLVIMNPPFTRPTNHEGEHDDVPIPAYAAFDTTPEQQVAMSKAVKKLTKHAPSNDYAGLASHFIELAHRKLRIGGHLAFVLPLSAASGGKWDRIRQLWREGYDDILVVTISAPGAKERSFSADTGMAECLVVARKAASKRIIPSATFVIVNQQPHSADAAALLSLGISEAREELLVSADTIAPLTLGGQHCGYVVQVTLENDLPWPHVGVEDVSLVGICEALKRGQLIDIQRGRSTSLGVCHISEVATVGPVHRSVGSLTTVRERGAFAVFRPPVTAEPTFPVLWAHNAKQERKLIVMVDSEGIPRPELEKEATRIWATASRAHYNSDLQFNAQSIIVAMTDRKCIGGRAWPSVILHESKHEYVFSLWCNSTLGLLLHWWVSNKTQAGRGTTTVTGIPNIPTLDTRALTDAQHAEAKRQFDLLRDERFLPFDQIDEDPARAKLDRAILVNVLGLPESLVAPDGPIDLIRRKLAREPQIHGGKKSRVVFTDHGETSVKRPDRG